jgi:Uma2 family endonuclease
MTALQASEDARRTVPEPPVSYEEFLEWADENTRAEWVDGQIQVMSPASDKHQDLVRFLTSLFSTVAEESGGEALVRPAPFQMRLEDRPSGREPDVLVVTTPHGDRVRETHLEGPADLVVEIVSPKSGPRDRGEKFYEYEAAGIPEYWIVDPDREQLEVYRLERGQYRGVFMGADGRVESEVLEGLWIRAEWLWRAPLPRLLEVLSELDLV